MKVLKTGLILLGAKVVHNLIKLVRAGEGTSFVGALVLKADPNFIKSASSVVSAEKLAVTGTNGKTTTSGIITHILEKNGRKVIANRKGANMITGVANAFALTLGLGDTFENCVIESDEAYLAKIQESLNADYLVVTNIFPDQVDRYSDINFTKQKIQDGINSYSEVQLILNADDPLVASLKSDKPAIYYGVNSVTDNTGAVELSVSEERYSCPCGRSFEYSKKFYAQQGHYSCGCGYSRPTPNFAADIILEKDCSIIVLGNEKFNVPLVGLYNAYNALAAITFLKTIGVNNIQEFLGDYRTAFGRSEVRELKGRKVLIQLIKNPVGTNQVLRSVDLTSNVLIIINDNYADGRDISWLKDAEFERLKGIENKIIVSGLRADDMALRLRDAGLDADKIIVETDISKAIDSVLTISENDITIFPTYTALLTLNKLWETF